MRITLHDLCLIGIPLVSLSFYDIDLQIFMGLNEVKALEKSPLFAASIHVHPEYNNPNYVDYNNDIALIKLNVTLTFDSSVMPVCLPEPGATYDTGVMG